MDDSLPEAKKEEILGYMHAFADMMGVKLFWKFNFLFFFSFYFIFFLFFLFCTINTTVKKNKRKKRKNK
jgi:hypothetical protein